MFVWSLIFYLSSVLLPPRAEAAIALRQRLNETVDALDALKKEHVELETKFENQKKELTIAKSDRKSTEHQGA